MKIVGIGELFIPHEHIMRGFLSLAARGVEVATFDWELSGFQELQDINHLVEREGSEAFDPPGYVYEAVRDAAILVTEFCPVPAKLIDEQALFEALRDRRIEGAALDVFDKEPPGKDYPLVTLDNVTLTPHMAGGSNDAFFNSPSRLAAEIVKLWDGEMSRFIVNKEVFLMVAPSFRG